MTMAKIKYFQNVQSFLKKEWDKENKYLFFMASKKQIDLSEFNEQGLDFIGVIFPQVIYNNKLYDSGLIVLQLDEQMELLFIKNTDTITFQDNEFSNCKSVISIVEGFSEYNESFLSKLFSNVDVNTNILGGGAGTFNNLHPAFFDKNGYYSDSAVLIKIKNHIDIGVRHGCQYFKGPFVATSCDTNMLNSIDHQSAFELYKQIIQEDCSIELNEENFLSVAANYPLGIVKYNCEQIVREPIRIHNDGLIVLGDIKENTVLNILKVNKRSMIEASNKAAKEVVDDQTNLIIMFDCLSRVDFLKESFTEELSSITNLSNKKTVFGAVTIGEIANSGNRYINFYNKTCVIGATCI